jgi:hypothetical protein
MTKNRHNKLLTEYSVAGSGMTGISRVRKLHKDWRTWLALILMLAAMAVYVLTLDDSVEPTGGIQKQGMLSTATAGSQSEIMFIN